MANLTWYQGFNARNGDRLSSQVRALLAFRKAGVPLNVTVQLAYDIVKEELGDRERWGR